MNKLSKFEKMKKRIFLFLMLFTMISAMPLMAQSDGFFNYSDQNTTKTRTGDNFDLTGRVVQNPMEEEIIPNGTPVGSGLLVLLVGGMAYAALKKKGE